MPGLSDAEVFGPAKKGLSDADVFGQHAAAPKAKGLSDADVFGHPAANKFNLDPTHLQRMRSLLHTITGKDISPGDKGDPLVGIENAWQGFAALPEGIKQFLHPTGPDKDVDYKTGLGSLQAATRLAQAENDQEKESILKHVYGAKNVGRDSKGGLYVMQKGKKVAAHPKPIQAVIGGLTGSAPETALSMLGATGGAGLGSFGGPLDEFTVPAFATIGAGAGGATGRGLEEMAKAILGDYHQKPGELTKHLTDAAIWNAIPEGAFRTVAGAVPKRPVLAPEMTPREGPIAGLQPAPAIVTPDTHLSPAKFAERVGDQLYTIQNRGLVDEHLAKKMLDRVPKEATQEDWEQITHFIENPTKEKLNPFQQKLYTDFIEPLRKDSRRAWSELVEAKTDSPINFPKDPKVVNGIEVGPGDIGHAHREAMGKPGFFSRFQEVGDGVKVGPRGMSTSASSAKRRSLYALQGEDGTRQVVHVGDGKIEAPVAGKWQTVSRFHRTPSPGDKIKVGDVEHTLTHATTKEIEAAGAAKYYKNSLATHIIEWTQLNQAARNARFVEDMKPTLEEAGIATKDPMVADAKGYVKTDLPQFAGWRMERHLAEVLDDLHKRINPKEGDWLATTYQNVSDAIVRALVFTPLPHTLNMATQWAISRGATGWLAPSAHLDAFNTMLKAAKSVINQDSRYLGMMDHGAALQLHRRDAGKLSGMLGKMVVGEIQKSPGKWAEIAKKFGYASPVAWGAAVWHAMEKVMWGAGDMFEISRIMELQKRGYTQEEAIKRAERTIVNYRLPSRVLNSRALKQALDSNLLLFNNYHYGVMNAYANMAADLVKPSATVAERLEAMDQMAALGLIMLKVKPTMDAMAKQATGKDNAEAPTPGMTRYAKLAGQVAKGEKTPLQTVGSLATPSPGAAAAVKLFYNRDPFSGKRVINDHDPEGALLDLGWMAMDEAGLGSMTDKTAKGEQKLIDDLLQWGVGVQFPNKAGQQYYQAKAAREDAKRTAERKETVRKATHALLKKLGLAH